MWQRHGDQHCFLLFEGNLQFNFLLQAGDPDLLKILNHSDIHVAHDLFDASLQQTARRFAEELITGSIDAFHAFLQSHHPALQFLVGRHLSLIHIGIIKHVSDTERFAFKRAVERAHQQTHRLPLFFGQRSGGSNSLFGHIPDFDGICRPDAAYDFRQAYFQRPDLTRPAGQFLIEHRRICRVHSLLQHHHAGSKRRRMTDDECRGGFPALVARDRIKPRWISCQRRRISGLRQRCASHWIEQQQLIVGHHSHE